MRTVFGRILIGLGGFLLLVGLFGLFWAPGQVEKLPLGTDSVTSLGGTGGKVDSATGELDSGPLVASSITQVDAEASDGDVAVVVNTSCLMKDVNDPPVCVDGDDPRLLNASQSVVAQDRSSALSVDNDNYVPEGTPQTAGLTLKWPFNAEKKDYQYWDATVGTTVPAVYDREETIDGVTTYVYKVTVEDAPVDVIAGVPGTYSSAKEIFVEPVTGAPVNQTEVQERALDDGTVVLQLQLAFSPEQQKQSIADAKDNVGSIKLITRTVPIIGIVGGLLALAGGAFLLVMGGRRDDYDDDVYAGKRTA